MVAVSGSTVNVCMAIVCVCTETERAVELGGSVRQYQTRAVSHLHLKLTHRQLVVLHIHLRTVQYSTHKEVNKLACVEPHFKIVWGITITSKRGDH